jgi:hypothetical protein
VEGKRHCRAHIDTSAAIDAVFIFDYDFIIKLKRALVADITAAPASHTQIVIYCY